MSNCRHHWSLKGVNCPYCVDELIKSKDKELATAKARLADLERKNKHLETVNRVSGRVLKGHKEALATARAENGRLVGAVRAITDAGWPYGNLAERMIRLEKVLSTSNALDYWQGEIRKARAEVFQEAAGHGRELLTDSVQKSGVVVRSKVISMINVLEFKARKLSNQSKGETGGG